MEGILTSMSRKLEMINVWAQILTGIAVITGLGLVVWELQITRQASYDMYALIAVSDDSADSSAMYGELAAEAITKACFEPGSLTNAELFILGKYFENRLNRVFQTLWQGKFLEDETWKDPATYWLKRILSYPQGEIYLRSFIDAEEYEIEIAQLVQDVIAAGNYPSCRVFIGRLRLEG